MPPNLRIPAPRNPGILPPGSNPAHPAFMPAVQVGVQQIAVNKAAERLLDAQGEAARLDPLERDRVGDLLDPTLASMAREIAQDIDELDAILERYGFIGGAASPYWEELNSRKPWTDLLAQQIREWSAVDSTPKRITAKAQAAVEAALPGVFAITRDPNAKEADRLKAFELLGKVGKVSGGEGDGGFGGRGGVTLQINFTTTPGQVAGVSAASRVDENAGRIIEGEVSRIVGEPVKVELGIPGFLLGDPEPFEGEG